MILNHYFLPFALSKEFSEDGRVRTVETGDGLHTNERLKAALELTAPDKPLSLTRCIKILQIEKTVLLKT